MCVILICEPGYTPPLYMIQNSVWNNPHGYGLIIKKDGKLEVHRELPEGGNDPDVIYRMLKDNEAHQRFLHVRWMTQGDISYENTQPFKVYENGDRHIEFMHNGTLPGYNATSSYVNGKTIYHDSLSDSRRFAENVLQRYLPKIAGANGVADIQDKDIQEILHKYWSGTNRGLLVCSDLEPFFFSKSSWEIIKTKEVIDGVEVEGSFIASNNDYFEKLKRGKIYEEREAEKKKKEEEERAARVQGVQTPQVIPSGGLTSHGFFARHGVTESISDLLEDFDMYSKEGYIALSNLTYEELIKMVKNSDSDDIASLLLHLTNFLRVEAEGTDTLEAQILKLNEKLREYGEEELIAA